MKKILFIVLLLLSTGIYSLEIKDVTFKVVDESIEIEYKLNSDKANNEFNVQIFYTLDNGKTFDEIKTAKGDIGNNILPGNKKIIWYPLKDNIFIIGEIKFKVNAVSSNKMK